MAVPVFPHLIYNVCAINIPCSMVDDFDREAIRHRTEKMNAHATDERRELPHSISGCESNRIDSQRKNSNAENGDDRSDLVNAKATKGGKTKYTCTIWLDAMMDCTPQKPGQDFTYCDSRCQS